MTYGQEFHAFATLLKSDLAAFDRVVPLLAQLNLGATAIGTGICADLRFRKSAIKHLAQITGLPVTAAPDPVAAMTDMGAYVATSAAIKSLAVHLKKAADDLRLLNSGPRCGFNDLNVPARQAGSSIMPAKVNPVIPECVNQCCFTIFGMDVTVNWAVAEGQLQLNAFDPVMVHELLTGMALLTHAMETFRVNCVEGIEINADLGRSYAQSSPSISAALNHYIGYEHAADIAAEAVHTGRTVREVAGERTDLPPSSWTRFSIRFDWPAASARPAANARSSGIDRSRFRFLPPRLHDFTRNDRYSRRMTEYAEDIARWFQVNAGKLIWLTIVLAIVFVADRVISACCARFWTILRFPAPRFS